MLQTPQPPPPEAFLTSLINDIAATPAPFVLVLDDYHLIQAPPIHQQLAYLLEHQPPQMHLVIITREDPPLPLARLRARGQITDIRQSDLKFTEEETADFLRQVMQLDLSPADVATLQRRTEGWIAGLQLAALSMQQSEDVRQFVAEFAGSHRYVLDYLVEEVYRRQAPDVQDFLLKTSILDRLTAPLCDAVLGIANQRTTAISARPSPIRRHSRPPDRANLFIVRLDEARQWYRYHRLFRDLLRIQREALDTAALHRRAAAWFEQQRLPGRGVGSPPGRGGLGRSGAPDGAGGRGRHQQRPVCHPEPLARRAAGGTPARQPRARQPQGLGAAVAGAVCRGRDLGRPGRRPPPAGRAAVQPGHRAVPANRISLRSSPTSRKSSRWRSAPWPCWRRATRTACGARPCPTWPRRR